MVKVFDNLVRGETIVDFSSTGIKDNSTKLSLVVEDDKIVVKTANIETIDNDLTIRGDVRVFGVLNAGFIRTNEIITNQRYEKQYLEFAPPTGESVGSGLLWLGGRYKRQLVFKLEPDRFWMTENVDVPREKSFMIDGIPALSATELGKEVVNSNLRTVGELKTLRVAGDLNIGDHVFYNPISQRFSLGTENANGLFTVYDAINDVELVMDGGPTGLGRIGTYSTKGLDIVTDNQSRINISEAGNVTIGHEQKDSNVTRIYGKLGIGVKNPREQLEILGNMRMGNRLFANGDGIPTEGSYQKGDIIWNSNPRDGSVVGWICLVGGAPGSWKPFGQILNN